jgi:hypothetical protein
MMKTRFQQAIQGLAVLCVTSWAGAAMAATAVSPICDAAARVVCPSGSLTGALEISNDTCNTWNHRAMLSGVYSYRYFGGCGNSCTGNTCNGGAGNYYTVTGSSGWDFRQIHFNSNASSGSKACDRCSLGLIGATGSASFAHSHSENRQYGTRKTAWFAASVSCGATVSCTSPVGYPTL